MESCFREECDKIDPEISFSIEDASGPAGSMETEEVAELANSLRDLVEDHTIKPKLQCIMADPSFSMVTVQSEDSGIVWETTSSRCSTPWASEASTTSDVYSLDGSAVGSSPGKIVFIMDEEKMVRRRKKASLGSRTSEKNGRSRVEKTKHLLKKPSDFVPTLDLNQQSAGQNTLMSHAPVTSRSANGNPHPASFKPKPKEELVAHVPVIARSQRPGNPHSKLIESMIDEPVSHMPVTSQLLDQRSSLDNPVKETETTPEEPVCHMPVSAKSVIKGNPHPTALLEKELVPHTTGTTNPVVIGNPQPNPSEGECEEPQLNVPVSSKMAGDPSSNPFKDKETAEQVPHTPVAAKIAVKEDPGIIPSKPQGLIQGKIMKFNSPPPEERVSTFSSKKFTPTFGLGENRREIARSKTGAPTTVSAPISNPLPTAGSVPVATKDVPQHGSPHVEMSESQSRILTLPGLSEPEFAGEKCLVLETEQDTSEHKESECEKELFGIVSECYEILNIIVPPKMLTVDEEESIYMEDNLDYLEKNPLIIPKPMKDTVEDNEIVGTEENMASEIKQVFEMQSSQEGNGLPDLNHKAVLEQTDANNLEQGTVVTTESTEFTLERRASKSGNDMDYFEKFTLFDEKVPTSMQEITLERCEVTSSNEVDGNDNNETECILVTEDQNDLTSIENIEIAGEHLDEVFYGSKYDQQTKFLSKHNSEDETSDKDTVKRVLSPPKESGSCLFGEEEETLIRHIPFPVITKIIDPSLLEEPPAMAFLYKDLYENAVGEKTKNDSEPSDVESITSDASVHSKASDSDDNTGIYFEKYILKDEFPSDMEVETKTKEVPETVHEKKRLWQQSTFDLTGTLSREKAVDNLNEKLDSEFHAEVPDLSLFDERQQLAEMYDEVFDDLEFQAVVSDDEEDRTDVVEILVDRTLDVIQEEDEEEEEEGEVEEEEEEEEQEQEDHLQQPLLEQDAKTALVDQSIPVESEKPSLEEMSEEITNHLELSDTIEHYTTTVADQVDETSTVPKDQGTSSIDNITLQDQIPLEELEQHPEKEVDTSKVDVITRSEGSAEDIYTAGPEKETSEERSIPKMYKENEVLIHELSVTTTRVELEEDHEMSKETHDELEDQVLTLSESELEINSAELLKVVDSEMSKIKEDELGKLSSKTVEDQSVQTQTEDGIEEEEYDEFFEKAKNSQTIMVNVSTSVSDLNLKGLEQELSMSVSEEKLDERFGMEGPHEGLPVMGIKCKNEEIGTSSKLTELHLPHRAQLVPEQSDLDLQQCGNHEDEEETAEALDYEMITHQDIHDYSIQEIELLGGEEQVEHLETRFDFVDDIISHIPAEEEVEADYEIIEALGGSSVISDAELDFKEVKKPIPDTYCHVCRCPILAIDKLFGDHQDHEVSTLDESVFDLKKKLVEFITEMQSRTEKIEDLVSELELAFNTVEENCTKTEQQLDKQNDEMMKAVLDRYNEMSQNLEDEKKIKLEQLYDQLVTFQESIESAKDILEKAVKESEEPDELTFVSSSNEINTSLTKALEATLSLELTPSAFMVFEDYAKSTSGNGHKLLKSIGVPQTPRLQPQEANSATSSSVTVYWKVNEGDVIDCFQVYCMEDPQGAMAEEYRVTVKESYCTLEDLEPDKCYLVWVMAVNYTGCSLPSEKTSFRTAPSCPVIKSEECTVCWDTAIIRWQSANLAAVESFTLEYCRQYACEGEGLRSISGIRNCEQKVLLQPNENYLFYLKAVNYAGSSEQSEAALISTKGTRFHFLKETANSALAFSEDNKMVFYHEQTFKQRANLNDCLGILGELLPPRGFHYWETAVGGSEAYRIGVAYASAPRDTPLGQNSSSWCIHCYPLSKSHRFEFLHNMSQADIQVVNVPSTIGTLLDYVNGRLLFFNAQTGQLLYSCRHIFTEPCHPAFALEKPGSLSLCSGTETPDIVKHS
ncbi:cardiomyopathy-associated protein 5 [Erpetoichthys calabaricus]|uniref:cardiomyopathy-associated protein 5 n=1 Tax=Erpetoichthys calabaricus TaxID=27687 RepID=UPI002234453C|nr:cardiomyopathy-associated protein 5 [Erpetoichthys calabaricus]